MFYLCYLITHEGTEILNVFGVNTMFVCLLCTVISEKTRSKAM